MPNSTLFDFSCSIVRSSFLKEGKIALWNFIKLRLKVSEALCKDLKKSVKEDKSNDPMRFFLLLYILYTTADSSRFVNFPCVYVIYYSSTKVVCVCYVWERRLDINILRTSSLCVRDWRTLLFFLQGTCMFLENIFRIKNLQCTYISGSSSKINYKSIKH